MSCCCKSVNCVTGPVCACNKTYVEGILKDDNGPHQLIVMPAIGSTPCTFSCSYTMPATCMLYTSQQKCFGGGYSDSDVGGGNLLICYQGTLAAPNQITVQKNWFMSSSIQGKTYYTDVGMLASGASYCNTVASKRKDTHVPSAGYQVCNSTFPWATKGTFKIDSCDADIITASGYVDMGVATYFTPPPGTSYDQYVNAHPGFGIPANPGGAVYLSFPTANAYKCCSGTIKCNSCPQLLDHGKLNDPNGSHNLFKNSDNTWSACYSFMSTGVITLPPGSGANYCSRSVGPIALNVSYLVKCAPPDSSGSGQLSVTRTWPTYYCANDSGPYGHTMYSDGCVCGISNGQLGLFIGTKGNSCLSAFRGLPFATITKPYSGCSPLTWSSALGIYNPPPDDIFGNYGVGDPVGGIVTITIPSATPLPKKDLFLNIQTTGSTFGTNASLIYANNEWASACFGTLKAKLLCANSLSFYVVDQGGMCVNNPGAAVAYPVCSIVPASTSCEILKLVSVSNDPFMVVFQSSTSTYTITE